MYRDDPDLQALIDWVQIYFKCCGMRSPHDWDMNIYFNKSSQQFSSPEAGGVPYSCCKQLRGAGGGPINYFCGHGARLMKEVSIGLLHHSVRFCCLCRRNVHFSYIRSLAFFSF